MSKNSVCFINLKGGVGKSTLSVAFVEYLALVKEQRVLLINSDPQCNSTAMMAHREEARKTKRGPNRKWPDVGENASVPTIWGLPEIMEIATNVRRVFYKPLIGNCRHSSLGFVESSLFSRDVSGIWPGLFVRERRAEWMQSAFSFGHK